MRLEFVFGRVSIVSLCPLDKTPMDWGGDNKSTLLFVGKKKFKNK
jgi:hypothetical protein